MTACSTVDSSEEKNERARLPGCPGALRRDGSTTRAPARSRSDTGRPGLVLNGLERKGRGRSGQEQKRRVRPKVGPYRGQNNIATTRGRVGGVAVAQTETRNLPHPSSPAQCQDIKLRNAKLA